MVNSLSARASAKQRKFYLMPDVVELLQAECVSTGMPMSYIIEQLVRKHCGKAPPQPREKRFRLNV